jgi:2-polyprenyl-3-methyl-5-hydroxy-6-metoxy-1,4-benzoquinol methylase
MEEQTEQHFPFGKNWESYVTHALDESRIQIATQALKDLLELESLSGQTFLDIGCGSGLHSLAAYRLDAEQIVSFDYDLDSVRTTERLRSSVGNPANWQVFQGSIRDDALVAKYHAKIVYSWGVLHHTGNMWQAIRNAGHMVEPGGLFCIAIYNKVENWRDFGTSAMWQKIKRTYVNSPKWRKKLMVWAYEYAWGVYAIVRQHKNPFAKIRAFNERGMDWHHDVVDWVGGYPFEYASIEEITTFCEQELHMQRLKVIARTGHANNEFVFRLPPKI